MYSSPQFVKDLAKENNWREELVDGVFNALWNYEVEKHWQGDSLKARFRMDNEICSLSNSVWEYENVTRKIRDTIKNNSEFQNMVRLVIKSCYGGKRT